MVYGNLPLHTHTPYTPLPSNALVLPPPLPPPPHHHRCGGDRFLQLLMLLSVAVWMDRWDGWGEGGVSFMHCSLIVISPLPPPIAVTIPTDQLAVWEGRHGEWNVESAPHECDGGQSVVSSRSFVSPSLPGVVQSVNTHPHSPPTTTAPPSPLPANRHNPLPSSPSSDQPSSNNCSKQLN